MSQSSFGEALNEQVANEFAAHQQYVAIAVHYDAETLPRLAAFFYRQAVEERNHAMMITQYLLDADLDVRTPGVDAPEVGFADIVTPVELALAQEYQDVAGMFRYAVETERRFYLANEVDVQVEHEGGQKFFRLTLNDAWVWDMYRPARFVTNVRVLTFRDVNIEELAGTGL